MEAKIKALLIELKRENEDRTIAINDRECSKYIHSKLTHKYNNTLEIIKRIETILN